MALCALVVVMDKARFLNVCSHMTTWTDGAQKQKSSVPVFGFKKACLVERERARALAMATGQTSWEHVRSEMRCPSSLWMVR